MSVKELSETGTNQKQKLIHDGLEMSPYDKIPLTDDTTCGFWIFRGPFLQRFANKKAYIGVYGVAGCLYSAAYAYFNGTITTIEKRYKIPSKHTGIITVGFDISVLFVSAIFSYYAGKGHRPRWMAFGLFTIVLFCMLTALPHLMYGPGEDALSLTVQYGSLFDDNVTQEVLEKQKQKSLCSTNANAECEMDGGNWTPLTILFLAQLLGGVGGCLYYTLGVSYLDDNIKRSKTPAMISFSYVLRMLGPAVGYALASLCLKIYIAPSLTPTITINDPRWLGAWWLGWIIFTVILSIFGILVGLFPKELPRAAVRKRRMTEKIEDVSKTEMSASFADMMETFKRLVKNKTFMLNNISTIFYFFGYTVYWIFTPKYIETQYRQSASVSNLATGTVAIAFSAFGVLLSGIVISKYQPSARCMAAWNVFVGAISVIGMVAYVFLGCSTNDDSISEHQTFMNDITTCNMECECDYVSYSPVCGSNGNTYISACHAGCKRQEYNNVSGNIFSDCTCIDVPRDNIDTLRNFGTAISGTCPVDCFGEFVLFLIVMCLLKFAGATGRASNFLVSIRCVDEEDKSVSMGFSVMMVTLFSSIPAPIFFGYILDKTCLLWGKTCSGTGNCWLYDVVTLRYSLNLIAAVVVLIGTLFDIGVWYYVKDLRMFDDKIDELEIIDFVREPDECATEKN